MSMTFRPCESGQTFLRPASMRDWLPGDHLAYFISDVVDHLDLSAIMERYADEERGYPPYHPAMMVKVLLYAYCIGVASSGKIEKRLCEDIAFPGYWRLTTPRTSAPSQTSVKTNWKR